MIKHPKEVFSKIGLSLFVYILTVNILAVVANIFCMKFFYDFATGPYYTFVMSAVVQYGVGLPIVYFMLRRLPNYRYDGEKLKISSLLGCFAVLSSCGYIGSMLGNAVNNFLGSVLEKDIVDPLDEMLLKSPMWLSFVVVVVIGPIVEELIFRRFIIDKVRPYGEMLAVIFSGTVFGAFHGNFSQFFYASAIGMVLAYVYIRTMKLRYPVFLHMLFNFVFGFIPLAIQKYFPIADETFTNPESINMPAFLVNSLFGLFVFTLSVLGIIYFFKKKKRVVFLSNYYEIQRGQRFKFTILNGGMIAFSIICLAEFILYLFV